MCPRPTLKDVQQLRTCVSFYSRELSDATDCWCRWVGDESTLSCSGFDHNLSKFVQSVMTDPVMATDGERSLL